MARTERGLKRWDKETRESIAKDLGLELDDEEEKQKRKREMRKTQYKKI